MAVGFILWKKCGRCDQILDHHISGVSTCLGPEALLCPKCGACIATGRSEWASLTTYWRARYVVRTIVYAAFVGWVGAASVRAALQFLEKGPSATKVPVGGPGLVEGLVFWIVLVLALQVWRVRASTRRTSSATREPDRPRFGNLKYKLHVKLLTLAFTPALLGWLVSYLTHG
jgi:hypothetical protein